MSTRRAIALSTLVVVSLVAAAGPALADHDEAGSVTIEVPESYYPGEQVNLSGNASDVSAVAVYVRENADWQLADVNGDGDADGNDTVAVSGGTWTVENVTLSEMSPMLDIPGNYWLGVVAADDARDEDGELRATLTPSRFAEATGHQRRLLVDRPHLDATFETADGEVVGDGGSVGVSGTAAGMDAVAVVVVDSRGSVAVERIPVDGSAHSFDGEVALVDAEGGELTTGDAVGLVVGLGRDGVAGDARLDGAGGANLSAFLAYVETTTDARPLSAAQVVSVLRHQTVEAAGSDDHVVEQSFVLASAVTTVESVAPQGVDEGGDVDVPAGDVTVVSGTTNYQSGTTIRVEVLDAGSPVAVATTDQWDDDGRWSVSLDTENLAPGSYDVEVSVAGRTVETATLQVVEDES